MLSTIFPITCHTRHVGPGSSFVAIKGFATDGTRFIDQAIAQGAKHIIIERCAGNCTHQTDICGKFNLQNFPDTHIFFHQDITYEFVENARRTLAHRVAIAFGNPSKRLKIVGITGTKGKTTTAYLAWHMFKYAGYNVALASTIACHIGDTFFASSRTTMESDELQFFLAACVDAGVEYVVMEVSSHALTLDRTHGIDFSVVAFTNFAPDHLDFHGTENDYLAAKCLIFDQLKTDGIAIINGDDQACGQIYAKINGLAKKKFLMVSSYDKKHDTHATKHWSFQSIVQQHTESFAGLRIQLTNNNQAMLLQAPALLGNFNGYNLAMAAIVASHFGIATTEIASAAQSFPGVPGRMQIHKLASGAIAIVDYAHNALSMENVLHTLRPLTNNLIVIFGCGGDRDKTRRFTMGAIASRYADLIILTNDNPRSEAPAAIVADIQQGIAPHVFEKVVVKLDRAQAISYALSQATQESVIALLGMGHEKWLAGEVMSTDFEQISLY